MNNLLNTAKQFATRMKDIWNGLNLNQRILIAAAGLLLIIALAVLFVGNRPGNFEVLYTDLSEKDAESIVSKLEEDRIAYKLQDSGTTILVDPAVKYRTRLTLAGENLPQGESGFELFQTNNFSETQSDKKVKYQVALQGELARTIQSLENVKSARVHLVMPEKSLFSDAEEKSSAAVAITMKEGVTLSAKEVKGIVNLISNSIEGLKPEDVVIVDHNGNLISDKYSAEETNSTEQLQSQLALKRQFEREEEVAIQSMLDKTLGIDNAVVRVSAELNFDQRQETTEMYNHDPEGPFIRSEHIVTESSTSSGTIPGGTPGTDTNVPQYTQTDNGSTTTSSDMTDKTRNHEINKTETVTQYGMGDTKYDYLTVSVLVNSAGTIQLKLGDTEEEKVDKIRGIVATAVGLRENRSNENVSLQDNISVAFMDFYSEPVPEPESQTGFKAILSSPYMAGIAFAAILAFVLLLIAGRRKRAREKVLEEMQQSGFEAVVDDEISIEDLFDKNLTPEEKENQKIRQEIDKLIKDNPESAAQVIKTWLLEE